MSVVAAFTMFTAAVAAAPQTPLDDAELRARFLSGDLVSLARARTLRAEAGEDVSVGQLGLLDDLSRLVRCQPLGRIPAHEAATFRAARSLVRIERIRLERRLRERAHQDVAVSELVGQNLYQSRGAVQKNLVRWPVSDERWPDEVSDPVVPVQDCTERPDEPEVAAKRAPKREYAERRAVSDALALLGDLPGGSAAQVAYAYVAAARESEGFVIPAQWDQPLTTALRAGPPVFRLAGLISLGRLFERRKDVGKAVAVYRTVLGDAKRSDVQDSRVRVRLAELLADDPDAVLAVASAAKKPRPADNVALTYAKARALYRLARWSELQSLGRVWLRTPVLKGELYEATADLMLRAALQLEPAEAMAWAIEVGRTGDVSRRLDRLARFAVQAQRIELAIAVYDRLREDAKKKRKRRGPTAVADAVRWTASRALLEYARNDAESFGGLVDELVAEAKKEDASHLARTAPQREVARLCQELLGRLTNDVAHDEERRRFAGVLLEAIGALKAPASRWTKVLERYRTPLRKLAGPWAVGRAEKPLLTTRRKPRIRSLGEVVIPRLPPALALGDRPTPVPTVDTFVVFQEPDGRWTHGAPWRRLISEKSEKK